MEDEPEIIKMLREAEKLGSFQSKVQSAYEELEIPGESSEDVPDETVGFVEDDVERNTVVSSTTHKRIKKEKRESGIDIVGDVSEEPKIKNKGNKSTTVDMEMSTFEIPPAGDILALAKHCPIGKQAVKRMLNAVAPNQFEFVQVEDDIIETIAVKKYLFLRAEKEPLIKAIVREAKTIMGPKCMITIRCRMTVRVKSEI